MARGRYTWARPIVAKEGKVALEDFGWYYLGDRSYMADVERGLTCAYLLAENRRARWEAAQDGEEIPELLDVKDFAAAHGLSPVTVNKWIARAHRHFVGLTDREIATAAQRRRRAALREKRPERVCAEPSCRREMPGDLHANRRYCDEHRTGRARTARSRSRGVDGS